jgi:hypothetical protein
VKKDATVKYYLVSLNCCDISSVDGLRVLHYLNAYSLIRSESFSCDRALKTPEISYDSLREFRSFMNLLYDCKGTLCS